MDRAKYRGLRTDGQGWVYGCLVVKHGIPYILTTFRISKYSKKIGYSEIEVIPTRGADKPIISPFCN